MTKLFQLIPGGGLFYTEKSKKKKDGLTFILRHRNVALEIYLLL